MSEAIGLSGDFAPAFAMLCTYIGGGDVGVSLSLDSGAASFESAGADVGAPAPSMEP